MPFSCGSHQAFVYAKGGYDVVGELTPLSSVRWERVRDDISTAQVSVPTTECCELLGEVRCILHELHIYRNGEPVWEGPITRIEYEHDQVQLFAEDVLWQAKRTVLDQGYDQTYPNITSVLTRMDWLLRDKCYALHGDPWNVVSHLHPITHPGDPRTSRVVNAYQFYVWEDFDKYAEDSGSDYTVVNRDVYYFDGHLAWSIIPPLDPSFLSQFPRIVEYGNELATQGFVTNGQGQAGSATNAGVGEYGFVDFLVSNVQEGTVAPAATPEEVANWAVTAAHNIDDRYPTPVAVIVPENTSLMPDSPWTMDMLVPGSWFEVALDHLCRSVTAWTRLQHVIVTEEAPNGETVQISCVTAPSHMVIP